MVLSHTGAHRLQPHAQPACTKCTMNDAINVLLQATSSGGTSQKAASPTDSHVESSYVGAMTSYNMTLLQVTSSGGTTRGGP